MYSAEFCKWTLSYDDGGVDARCPRCGEDVPLTAYSDDLGVALDAIIGHLEDKHRDTISPTNR